MMTEGGSERVAAIETAIGRLSCELVLTPDAWTDLAWRGQFAKLNLIEVDDLGRRFLVIFCRNVMIYFDRPVQQRVVSMLEHHLEPGGYLFIAHSECLNGVRHGLGWVAPAVYQRGPS